MDNQSVTTPRDYQKILAAFDGSTGATRALRRAMELADQYGAQLVLFSVHEHLPRYAPGVGEVVEEGAIREEHFALLREQALAVLGEMGSRVEMETETGHAAQAIIRKVAEGGIDLVVIGHSGRSALWGTLLGSTTDRVVHQAHCDVLVVR